jgi:cytidylate kinase
VLVGRGAQCILGERADVLHIFCYAPRDALAARVAARLGISIPDAAREVEQRNHQREQYVRRYWKRSWLAFDNYHLCINTGAMGIEETVALVVRVACERFALTP